MRDPSQNIPNASSPAEQWIQWHKDLKRVLGKKQANSLWVQTWSKRGGENVVANTSALRAYMSSQGVDISRTYMAAIGDGISGFGGGIVSMVKWTMIGGGVIVGLIILSRVLKKK